MVRLVLAALRRLGAGVPRRYFADRGAIRVDYSDTGFQKRGYIDENCCLYTQGSGFKAPDTGGRSRQPPEVDADTGCIGRKDYLVKERRLGDARRRYEQQACKDKAGEESVYARHWRRLQESGEPEPRAWRSRRPVNFQGIKLITQKRCMSKKRSGPKGVLMRYSDYTFPGSRADEFTTKLAASKIKRQQRCEETNQADD